MIDMTDESNVKKDDDGRQTCVNPEPKIRNISTGELALGIIALIAWVIFFLLGLLSPTEDLRGLVMNKQIVSIVTWIVSFLKIGIAYTLTNIFFLSCVASILGCMTHRWQVSDMVAKVRPNARSFEPRRIYMSAFLRGFFLYLVCIAGFIIVSKEDNIYSISYEQYVRIAAMISTLGFIIGYDPNLLVKLMNKVLEITDISHEETNHEQAK